MSNKVFQAMGAVAREMANIGIAKAKENQQQGFKFRGIDDVLNALSTVLVNANLVVVPTVLERLDRTHLTQRGGTLFYVSLKVKYTMYSTEDGSSVESVLMGEAMDSGDKATNKAMSAAYKYWALQTFCIPTESAIQDDADLVTHDRIAQADHDQSREVLRQQQQDRQRSQDNQRAAEKVQQDSQQTQAAKQAGLSESNWADLEIAMKGATAFDDGAASLKPMYVTAYRALQAANDKDGLVKLGLLYGTHKERLHAAGEVVPGFSAPANQ